MTLSGEVVGFIGPICCQNPVAKTSEVLSHAYLKGIAFSPPICLDGEGARTWNFFWIARIHVK